MLKTATGNVSGNHEFQLFSAFLISCLVLIYIEMLLLLFFCICFFVLKATSFISDVENNRHVYFLNQIAFIFFVHFLDGAIFIMSIFL